jgi:hypothetical protein
MLGHFWPVCVNRTCYERHYSCYDYKHAYRVATHTNNS